ncbi:MAG: hypothetical protein JST30_06415 [Armatimonadetes bacterium]|nr:hypothetical protein [Armatimonadota bacterium]
MTPETAEALAPTGALGFRNGVVRSVVIAVCQESALLLLGRLAANWPGYPVSPAGRMLTRGVQTGWPIAIVAAVGIYIVLAYAERRVKAGHESGLASEQGRKFVKLFIAPSVPTVALASLLVWIFNVVGISMLVRGAREDAGMFLIMGLTFGTVVWGTLTFVGGLLVRAVMVRWVRG